MKTRYLLIGFLVFSFSMLLAQKTEMKVNPKISTQNVTKLNKQSVDSKSSINSAYSTQAVNAVTYDFTTGDGSQFHGGSAAAKQMSDGKWAMIAGNGNSSVDNVIDASDYGIVFNQFFQTGYKEGDYNLDGVADASDYSLVYSNFFRTSLVP